MSKAIHTNIFGCSTLQGSVCNHIIFAAKNSVVFVGLFVQLDQLNSHRLKPERKPLIDIRPGSLHRFYVSIGTFYPWQVANNSKFVITSYLNGTNGIARDGHEWATAPPLSGQVDLESVNFTCTSILLAASSTSTLVTFQSELKFNTCSNKSGIWLIIFRLKKYAY
ncbi:hypothetical protein [Rhodohalobacter sp. 8-1]|uniref:hypothetical protein n=1 Tax=Rhodohalobacter sp. 8-1 TaxID=3131972 RepID=UPI0030EE5354